MAAPSIQIGRPQAGGSGTGLEFNSSTIANPFASFAPSNFAAGFSGPGWATSILILVASLLVLEQAVYRNKKRHLPGATWTIPLIGKFTDSLKPTMKAYKKTWSTPLSVASVFNIFIVMASDNTLTRKILNSPNHTEPCLVASAKTILIAENWVFLSGKAHAEYRKHLNVLFTRRALAIYLKVQDGIYRQAFQKWMANSAKEGAQPHMMAIRDLNMETSLRVFCGNYLPQHACDAISDKYWLITRALELVNFPLAIPGTKVYKAVQARKIAMNWFMYASAESKKAMAEGGEPECLMDEWVREMISGAARMYSDHEIAMVLMSFLFASQDAMTSGLIFAFQLAADHPEVMAKIKAEQVSIRGADAEAPMTLEMLDNSPYLRAFVKEVLRYRPPVLMVPYMAKKEFQIREDYTCPKGSIVIPSFWNSLHDADVYTEPESFQPERWMPGGQAEKSNPQNYLVFGSGPHKCLAYDYAMMHIGAVIGSASMVMDWRHERTPTSDDIKIIATIFPEDDCHLEFTPATQDTY